ncbi:BA75_00757T0 [Komagataella pastoris]|uniref:Gluconokinase n=1 Tax=Komagataella pastoris TaxID=4922 RepID=A0A1B2J5S3_PICPA|nr:BA75_00757T0 [Komagataella pastoris]
MPNCIIEEDSHVYNFLCYTGNMEYLSEREVKKREDELPSLPVQLMKYIVIVGGPCGTGKSTVAHELALHYKDRNILRNEKEVYVEGDSFHSRANIDKMSAGIPLTDEDRLPWLITLAQYSTQQFSKETSGDICFLSCSALRKKYRDLLIQTITENDSDIHPIVVFLHGDPEVLYKRVSGRKNHFMKPQMIQSQLDTTEPPNSFELSCIPIDTTNYSTIKDEIDDVIGRLNKYL